MNFIKKFLEKQDTLERKLFWTILIMVFIIAFVSATFTVFEEINLAASLCSMGCAVLCLVVAGVAVKTSFYPQCYLVMCCMLNCFMLPMLFLFCGGITSGMPLYFVCGLMLLAFSSSVVGKTISFVCSIVIQVAVFIATWVHPELVFSVLNRDDSYLDIVVSLVLSGITVFFVAIFAMKAYKQEREKNARLLSRMDYLSSRDSLTEVYNRRYMTNFIANVLWHRRSDFYLLMLNIDNLKLVNDSYGHGFGDQVIMTVAHILDKSVDQTSNECVGRYDGDTFLYVITAGSEMEAFTKADKIRKSVVQSRWEDYPHVQVTVSGGFAYCGSRSFKDYRQMVSKVEALMMLAKSEGRNQVRNMGEN